VTNQTIHTLLILWHWQWKGQTGDTAPWYQMEGTRTRGHHNALWKKACNNHGENRTLSKVKCTAKDVFLERTASGNWFFDEPAGWVANDSLYDGRARLKISSQQHSWQRYFCTVELLRMHECICSLCGEYAFIFDRCCAHHACAGVYIRQVLWTSAYTFAYTLATGCAYALMFVQSVYFVLGNKDGGVQLVSESTRCLAWWVIQVLTEGKIGVLSVSSLFSTRVEVYEGVCVCIRMPRFSPSGFLRPSRCRIPTPGLTSKYPMCVVRVCSQKGAVIPEGTLEITYM